MGEGLLVAGRVEGVGLDLPEVYLVLVVLLNPVAHPLRAMHNYILLFIGHPFRPLNELKFIQYNTI